MWLEIFKFAAVLSFLVIIHELGHFLTAKWFKVRVEEFGLGYPPRALKLFKWWGTLFSLNWVPFGGFVKMEGEDGPTTPAGDVPTHSKKTAQHEGPFYEKSARARLVIILAGATVNFLFGVLAFSLYFSVKGIPELVSNPRIGEIAAESPAAKVGLPTQVEIKGVKLGEQFTPTPTTDAVIDLINAHLGEQLSLVTTGPCQAVECEATEQTFQVTLRRQDEIPAGQGALGIRFVPVIKQKFYPWYEMPFRGAWYGIQQAVMLSWLILVSLGDILRTAVNGRLPQEVAGPVGIFSQASKAGFFSQGVFELLNFAGLLSINLAIMNVLPIPALDGGRALFILLEKIIGRHRVAKVEGALNYGGFALLIGLIVLITVKDIRSLFVR